MVEDMSREPNVPERRSVFRGFKKYYGKHMFAYTKGHNSDNIYDQFCSGLTKE